jgi:hypothetical protein
LIPWGIKTVEAVDPTSFVRIAIRVLNGQVFARGPFLSEGEVLETAYLPKAVPLSI